MEVALTRVITVVLRKIQVLKTLTTIIIIIGRAEEAEEDVTKC